MVRTEALILPLSIKCLLFLVFLISLNVTTTFCCCSVTQSHPILCNPMDNSTPGLPVPYHLLEFVCPSSHSFHQCCLSSHLILWCPLLLLPSIFPSIRDFSNESSVPIRWPKYWSFNFSIVLLVNILGWSPFSLTGLISLLSQGLLRVFSSTTVRRHQFFGVLPSLRSRSHNHMWPLGRP